MKLFSRLLLAHAAPVLVLTVALAVALVALLRISVVLTTLNDTELATLNDEGALHRAAWALDVEMRHAHLACARGEAPEPLRRRIQTTTTELRDVLRHARPTSHAMQELVHGYLNAASQVLSAPLCDTLIGSSIVTMRSQLDEQLTNLWVGRLSALHHAVGEKENDARKLAVLASWLGVPLALGAFALAMLIAHRMSLVIKRPLTALSSSARRVGRGDFETPIELDGPPEIRELASDLERMRGQLRQIETLKQGFLASVSHELRTPLSKIREALSLLHDGAVGPLDDRQSRVVQIARTACEREIRMVTTLLDLSRLRAGSPIRLREDCSLDAVIEEALEDERAEAQQRGVSLDLIAPGETRGCPLDPVLMERAVANLVRNAVAVSNRGQRVRVERAAVESGGPRPGRWLRVRVSDEGPGVPVEIRDNLFDAFVTHPVPRSTKALGAGIGLALAREVARAHGGDLVLTSSDASSGSTFDLWLPCGEPVPVPRSDAPRSLGLDCDMVATP